MNIKRNDNREVLLTPTQTGRIKMLLYLADGHESLQLSDLRIYRAWKEFFFESVCEMEELGLLRSIRTYPVSPVSPVSPVRRPDSMSMSCCHCRTRTRTRTRTSTRTSTSTSNCKDDCNCNEIRAYKYKYKERRYMNMRKNTDKRKKRNKSNTRDAWDVSGKAIEICPVLNWLAKQECDRINPHWLNKAWKSFLLDILCELEAEGLIKVSGDQASRPGD